jgi:hypothetical protein
MPRKTPQDPAPETPRTDLPPAREPYYKGYFGTEEEEGVEREEEADDREVDRGASEDAAGGDREIT